MTYEAILENMLSRISDDLDKREGSIIYDALAPAAYHLAQMYFALDFTVDLTSGDTAVGEYLDRIVADYGLSRKSSTYAERKIVTTVDVSLGTRWGINDLIYTVTEEIKTNEYKAVCNQLGDIGNVFTGAMSNIDNVSGVTATITDILIPGLEEESDEALRERFRQFLSNPAQNSNIAQYTQWANDYNGVGRAKVIPLWNGGNTVKIAITDGNYQPAETTLVDAFQKYIDPGASGLGNGVAPIGSKVTIVSGTKKAITVTANVVLADGYTEAEGTTKAVTDYLSSITYIKNSVNYMRIGSAILDCPSITDINTLKINNGTVDVTLTGEEIPVLDNISLVVVS